MSQGVHSCRWVQAVYEPRLSAFEEDAQNNILIATATLQQDLLQKEVVNQSWIDSDDGHIGVIDLVLMNLVFSLQSEKILIRSCRNKSNTLHQVAGGLAVPRPVAGSWASESVNARP
eukprot:s2345_g8.t1